MSLVYSTDGGRMCPQCCKPTAACVCGKPKRATGDGVARVQREKRNGKLVTLVKGLALDDAALAVLGKQLRAQCGSGGTVKDGSIEVQGDHADKIVATLQAVGHKTKLIG